MSRRELRAELAHAEAQVDRLQRSLVEVQHGASQARGLRGEQERQARATNSGVLTAGAGGRRQEARLQASAARLQELLAQAEARCQQLRDQLRG